MLVGLDHFIIAVADPDAAALELEQSLGMRAGPGGRHEAHGSFNRLLWLGDSYIELLGIADRSLAERAWFGPRAIEVLDRQGGGYVGLALASDDLSAEMRGLRQQGSRLGAPQAGERARADGRIVRWKVATYDAADPELGHMFLIEHDTAAAEWTPADRERRAAEGHPLGGPVRLVRVELPVQDMKLATMRLHRDFGLQFRPSLAGEGAREANIGRQALRLTRARQRPRLSLAGGKATVERMLLGCDWLIEPA